LLAGLKQNEEVQGWWKGFVWDLIRMSSERFEWFVSEHEFWTDFEQISKILKSFWRFFLRSFAPFEQFESKLL
jgi:hypothetical protein